MLVMVTHWQLQKILILAQHKGLEFPRWPGEGREGRLCKSKSKTVKEMYEAY